MLNYRKNGRRRFGRRLKRLLDQAETGLSRPNSYRMVVMMMMMYSRILFNLTNDRTRTLREKWFS
jgi:hypothetical protein